MVAGAMGGILRLLWVAIVLAGLSGRADAHKLSFDERLGSAEGWTLAYSGDNRSCLAFTKFSDGTTVWFGAALGDKEYFLALTNPDWESIESGKHYKLQFSFIGGGRWHGSFEGVVRDGEKGIIAGGLKEGFVAGLVRSPGVAVSLGRSTFAKLSLQGSPAAFEAVVKCQQGRKYAAASRKDVTSNPKTLSSGTGFFVTSAGHILTNHHVVGDCARVRVHTSDGLLHDARVLTTDARNDLGLLVSDLKPSQFAPLRPEVRLGENVSVYGFPLSDMLASTGNFTVGYVTALAGLRDDSSQLQISAQVHPGNSGGPVLDRNGNVVGVVVSMLNAMKMVEIKNVVPQNVNFAVKARTAMGFIEANGVKLDSTTKITTLESAEIAEQARSFTVKILCEGN